MWLYMKELVDYDNVIWLGFGFLRIAVVTQTWSCDISIFKNRGFESKHLLL